MSKSITFGNVIYGAVVFSGWYESGTNRNADAAQKEEAEFFATPNEFWNLEATARLTGISEAFSNKVLQEGPSHRKSSIPPQRVVLQLVTVGRYVEVSTGSLLFADMSVGILMTGKEEYVDVL